MALISKHLGNSSVRGAGGLARGWGVATFWSLDWKSMLGCTFISWKDQDTFLQGELAGAARV